MLEPLKHRRKANSISCNCHPCRVLRAGSASRIRRFPGEVRLHAVPPSLAPTRPGIAFAMARETIKCLMTQSP
jgi:hypothetical protein